MTEKYTGARDTTIEENTWGGLHISHWRAGGAVLGIEIVDDLREYFRDERDRKLGVWRWSNERGKQYLVRELGYGDKFRVVREEHYEQLDWAPEQYNSLAHSGNDMVKAIQAYREAHQEKKPWHNAKPGEVWVIEGPTFEKVACTVICKYEELYFEDPVADTFISIKGDISEGRRIWPESKES